MDKAKVLMLGFVLVLIVVMGALGLRELMSPRGNPGKSYLRICNGAYCMDDPDDVRFSKNPPYFVGEKYYWWIRITVYADANLSDVVVYDRLGGEFMIEGVSFVPIEKPGPYNYTFEYGAYELGASVRVTDGASAWWGSLDESGIVFDGFVAYWTEETLKAHFQWDIGWMEEGDFKEIYLTISTDKNPAGWQEFTSLGMYFLNSGATVKGIVESTGKRASAESSGIEIEVLEKSG